MKTLCRAWPALGLCVFIGCTSSNAEQSQNQPTPAATTVPEWARDVSDSTAVSAAATIQPIPDLPEDSIANDGKHGPVKPIPDDER